MNPSLDLPEFPRRKRGFSFWWILKGGVWLFVLLLLADAGILFPFLECLMALVFGWFFYMTRTMEQVEGNPDLLGMALLCLAGFVASTHALLRWIRTGRLNQGQWPWRASLSLVGILLLTFFIGTAMPRMIQEFGNLLHSEEPILVGRSTSIVAMANSVNYDLNKFLAENEGVSVEALIDEFVGSEARGSLSHGFFIRFRCLVIEGQDGHYAGFILFTRDWWTIQWARTRRCLMADIFDGGNQA